MSAVLMIYYQQPPYGKWSTFRAAWFGVRQLLHIKVPQHKLFYIACYFGLSAGFV